MRSASQVAEALVEVRKAFRLVYLYQQRALDLIQEISEQFDTQFYVWAPRNSGRPSGLTTPPWSRNIWDLLPMYDVSFLFLADSAASNAAVNSWMLEVRVQADSTFAPEGTDPDPRTFSPARDTRSTLAMFVYQCVEHPGRNWYYNIWTPITNRQDPPQAGNVLVAEGAKVIGVGCDLAEALDKAAVTAMVATLKQQMRSELGLMIA
jgi:hypothetical protein